MCMLKAAAACPIPAQGFGAGRRPDFPRPCRPIGHGAGQHQAQHRPHCTRPPAPVLPPLQVRRQRGVHSDGAQLPAVRVDEDFIWEVAVVAVAMAGSVAVVCGRGGREEKGRGHASCLHAHTRPSPAPRCAAGPVPRLTHTQSNTFHRCMCVAGWGGGAQAWVCALARACTPFTRPPPQCAAQCAVGPPTLYGTPVLAQRVRCCHGGEADSARSVTGRSARARYKCIARPGLAAAGPRGPWRCGAAFLALPLF